MPDNKYATGLRREGVLVERWGGYPLCEMDPKRNECREDAILFMPAASHEKKDKVP